LKEKGKNTEKGKSKYHGRFMSPKKSKERCWTCNKVGHFRRYCKEEKKGEKTKMNEFKENMKSLLRRMVEMPLLWNL